jgi:3-hydroxyisobutyrate dehydrogenase
MAQHRPELDHVGYIGLGIMGAAMASNLLKGGYKVTVWNRTPAKADALKREGADAADSPADLAKRGPQVVCINVTDTPDVEAVLFGENGIALTALRGLIVVDHSTISPVATQRFAERLASLGVTLLDAPVSGGDVGARNATLSIMVGGDADAFQYCLPMFQKMGKAITHLGPPGMGQVCKACNQVAVALNLLGTCEAMALAKQSGLDVEKMIQVVGAGAGASWQLTNLGPKIAKGDLAPGFMVDLVLKDLAIVADTARARKLPLAGTALCENYFRGAQANGGGRLGTHAISRVIEQLGSSASSSSRSE